MKIPPKRCERMGCTNEVDSGTLCSEHNGFKTRGRGRLDHSNLYNLSVWKRLRLKQLSEEPRCQRCAHYSILTAADSVDHVTPHRGDMQKFLDPNNLQSLCRSCHSHKTNREAQGHEDDYRV